jgi:hypothetical protein
MKYLLTLSLILGTLSLSAQYNVIHDTSRATCIVTDDDGQIIYQIYTGWFTTKVKIDQYALLYVEEMVGDIPRRVFLNPPFLQNNMLYYAFLDVDPETGYIRQRLDVTPTKLFYNNPLEHIFLQTERSQTDVDNLDFFQKWKVYE